MLGKSVTQGSPTRHGMVARHLYPAPRGAPWHRYLDTVSAAAHQPGAEILDGLQQRIRVTLGPRAHEG